MGFCRKLSGIGITFSFRDCGDFGTIVSRLQCRWFGHVNTRSSDLLKRNNDGALQQHGALKFLYHDGIVA